MHELSIALSIVEGVTEEAVSRDIPRVSAVHLRVGRFSGVVEDALLFAWDEACRGTILESSRLVIEDVPLVGHCRSCGEDRILPDVYTFFCPECQGPISEIVSGKELEVTAMEVEE
jgi:hydrogenase nickel incorporation protein HypA/HybF